MALLEADVNFKVVKELIDHIRDKALGQEVMTALSPAEQVVKIVHDELIAILGNDTAKLKFASQPPTVVLMAGLQGSGKTTTSGKLATGSSRADTARCWFRLTSIVRLRANSSRLWPRRSRHTIYEGKVDEANTATVERLVKEARREAINNACDVLIVDTAGRLHIDEQLMDEMQSLKKILNPQEILFVADSMTGQDAVRSADEFHKKLSLTGVVLTKMDGDAAAARLFRFATLPASPSSSSASAKSTTRSNRSIPTASWAAFSAWATFFHSSSGPRPSSTRGRRKISRARRSAATASAGGFPRPVAPGEEVGSMQSIMSMLPKIGPFANMQQVADKVDEKEVNRVEAIINSMTAYEREHHDVINGSRRKRIARGSGTSVQEVNTCCGNMPRCARCSRAWANPASPSAWPE